jgi:hypothetical protein
VGSEGNTKNAKGDGGKPCSCPFCDAPVQNVYPFCKDCGKELNHCSECGKPLPPGQDLCPKCSK